MGVKALLTHLSLRRSYLLGVFSKDVGNPFSLSFLAREKLIMIFFFTHNTVLSFTPTYTNIYFFAFSCGVSNVCGIIQYLVGQNTDTCLYSLEVKEITWEEVFTWEEVLHWGVFNHSILPFLWYTQGWNPPYLASTQRPVLKSHRCKALPVFLSALHHSIYPNL